MKLCLSCCHLWPDRSAYCGHCNRSFGARICPHGHRSPPSAAYCVRCGADVLTDHAAYLPFGWLNRLLGLGLCLVLLRWSVAHGAILVGPTRAVFEHALGFVLDRDPRPLESWLGEVFRALACGTLVIIVLPGRLGRYLRGCCGRSLRVAALLSRLARSVFRLFRRNQDPSP